MSPSGPRRKSEHHRFPRRCGDVPCADASGLSEDRVPPQMRGCPSPAMNGIGCGTGSPADAGMSPGGLANRMTGKRFPRRCGDVPRSCRGQRRPRAVPPQMRRCPRWGILASTFVNGSPADAGMSPPQHHEIDLPARFPRRCGDVPSLAALGGGFVLVPPQTRGCPGTVGEGRPANIGSPADAGMSLNFSLTAPGTGNGTMNPAPDDRTNTAPGGPT